MRRIVVSPQRVHELVRHPALSSYVTTLQNGFSPPNNSNVTAAVFKDDVVHVARDANTVSHLFYSSSGTSVCGMDLMCYKTGVALLKLSDCSSATHLGGGGGHFDADNDDYDDGEDYDHGAIGGGVGSSAASASASKSRELFLRRRYAGIMASKRAGPPSMTTLLMLLYCDEPQPDLSFLTWCNMTALDAGAKLVLVWTSNEAQTVFECLLSESYNSEGHLQASILTSGKPFRGTFTAGGAGRSSGGGWQSPSVMEILTNAFTVIPSVQTSDTSRLLYQTKSVAALLLSDPRQFVDILPSFTNKKAAKLAEIFNVEFPTTATRLADVQRMLSAEAEEDIGGGSAATRKGLHEHLLAASCSSAGANRSSGESVRRGSAVVDVDVDEVSAFNITSVITPSSTKVTVAHPTRVRSTSQLVDVDSALPSPPRRPATKASTHAHLHVLATAPSSLPPPPATISTAHVITTATNGLAIRVPNSNAEQQGEGHHAAPLLQKELQSEAAVVSVGPAPSLSQAMLQEMLRRATAAEDEDEDNW